MICSDKMCTRDAAVVVHWLSSGGPLPKCAQCAAWAVKVATAMGFDLPISSLEPSPKDIQSLGSNPALRLNITPLQPPWLGRVWDGVVRPGLSDTGWRGSARLHGPGLARLVCMAR